MILAPEHKRRDGLTLLEVLLALTIFLLALVAIGRLVDMGTDTEMEARFKALGSRLAADKMAEFESGAKSFDETEGTFEGDDSTWSWRMTAQDQGTPNLRLVTVTVYRDLKGRNFEVALSQMILDPAVIGTAGEAARPDGTTPTEGMP